jgi:putative spermidine/putrescine transport system permease protein
LNAHDISASGSLQESHADLPGIAAERQPGNLFDAQAILVVPALLFLLVFFGYPLMRLVYLSVDGPHLTFRHYISFFTEGYGSVLSRTISVSGVVTASCLVIGYPIAFVLATSSPKRRTLLLLAVLVPYLTSSLVRSYAWIVILDDKGVVNSLLRSVGFISAPLDLLYNYISVYIGMVQVLLPYMVLPLFATMSAIDKSSVLAAQSMGAGTLRTFLRVYLPLTLPGVRSGCLLVFLLALGFYITPAMLGGLRDVTLSMLITTQVTQLTDWGSAAAASMILLATTAVAVCFLGKPSGEAALVALGSRSAGSAPPDTDVVQSMMAPRPVQRTSMPGALPRKGALRQFLVNPHIFNGVQGKTVLFVVVVLGLLFLLLPTLVVVPISFGAASYLQFPPQAWSLRWYANFFSQPEWTTATMLSVRVALISTAVSTVLGTAAALALKRARLPLRGLAWAFLVSPLVVPTVVSGVALYQPLAQWGLIGHVAALVIGHSIGGVSYVVIVVSSILSSLDEKYERAAQSLGAGPSRVFVRVTLPLIAPGVLGGAIFAFIHSFDELVIAMFVSGIGTETLPLKMWEDIRNQIDPTIAAISSLQMMIPIVAILFLQITRVGPGFTKAN